MVTKAGKRPLLVVLQEQQTTKQQKQQKHMQPLPNLDPTGSENVASVSVRPA